MNITYKQTQYPNLKLLQIQPLSNHAQKPYQNRTLPLDKANKKPKAYYRFYCKHQILQKIKKVIFPTSFQNNIQADQIINTYFTSSLNPIYEKISKLPIQLYFCGFCKEVYFGLSQYFRHCLQQRCPINHDRSTYFFYYKNTFKTIKSEDISNQLSKHELKLIKQASYRKNNIIFASYELTQINKSSHGILVCGKCRYRNNKDFIAKYVNHCILNCNSARHKQNSHKIQLLEYKQDLIHFVNDVINFQRNFNLLALFSDSYIRLENNANLKKSNSIENFCANCKVSFASSEDFLQHSLFQCQNKPNQKSSYLVKRKIIKEQNKQIIKKVIKQKKQIKQSPSLQNQKKKENARQKQINHHQQTVQMNQAGSSHWQSKINSQLEQFRDMFHNIYFCGQCFNYFQDEQTYLAHCLMYMCPINHQRSSHLFINKQTKKLLARQDLRNIDLNQAINLLKKDIKLQKNIKSRLIFINKSTNQLQRNLKTQIYCGNCEKAFKYQRCYISHFASEYHPTDHKSNSHIIQFERIQIGNQQFKQLLMNILYCIQIIRFSLNKGYKLKKNEFIDVGQDYYCGKCDTLFGNKYEYILHSISVCNSGKNKYSSHFITPFTNSEIDSPLDIIVEENNHPQVQNIKRRQRNLATSRLIQIQQPQIVKHEQKSPIQDINKYEQNCMNQLSDKCKQQEFVKESGNQTVQICKEQPMNNIRKFLRPNINYNPLSKTKFYCGQCQIGFSQKLIFIDHLKECNHFQNEKSSHFYVSNIRFNKINEGKLLKRGNFRKIPVHNFSKYKQIFQGFFVCGCGASNEIQKFRKHLYNNHLSEIPRGSSHVALRYMHTDQKDRTQTIYLPINFKGYDPKDIFMCSCNPWKEYTYDMYVKHIMKRHSMKSPKFEMRIKE